VSYTFWKSKRLEIARTMGDEAAQMQVGTAVGESNMTSSVCCVAKDQLMFEVTQQDRAAAAFAQGTRCPTCGSESRSSTGTLSRKQQSTSRCQNSQATLTRPEEAHMSQAHTTAVEYTTYFSLHRHMSTRGSIACF